MEEKCLFCKIINKEIPAKIIYDDEFVTVIPDINPKNRIHFLILTSVHIKSFLDMQDKHFTMLTKMVKVVQRIIRDQKIEGGYQLLFNGGRYQHVPHLHWHLLAD